MPANPPVEALHIRLLASPTPRRATASGLPRQTQSLARFANQKAPEPSGPTKLLEANEMGRPSDTLSPR